MSKINKKVVDTAQFDEYQLSDEMFEVVENRDLHDKKLDTKPVGFFKDAMRRFKRNKGSVVAACIICVLIGFSIIAPFTSKFDNQFNDINLAYRLPKSKVFSFLGWDGCQKVKDLSQADYLEYKATEAETGNSIIKKVYSSYEQETPTGRTKTFYKCYIDSYTKSSIISLEVSKGDYQKIQDYQDEHNIQIIYPAYQSENSVFAANANIYYELQTKGDFKNYPVGFDATSDPDTFKVTPAYTIDATSDYDAYNSKMLIEADGVKNYRYATKSQGGYTLRLEYNRYCEYKYGFTPSFVFGSDQYGKDIYVRLSSGARFSFLFAIAISVINLSIGAIYGAIEGYYGGVTDMIMERVSDILSGVPFMVVVTLFKLHIMKDVGLIPTILFAFVLTGWIGMASNTRMQFYRYKNQEYVLAARTLGARDFRIMFKHIFPNALGTLITSCVLVIPSVIFSESSLSYLKIVNLDVGNITSVGTLLANGQGYLRTVPHIILFPAIFIALLMISFNLFGNGLRDAFNPSLRGSED